MKNEILKAIETIKNLAPSHCERPAYYCTQEQYDAMVENNMIKYFNSRGYRIVIMPSQINPEYENYIAEEKNNYGKI